MRPSYVKTLAALAFAGLALAGCDGAETLGGGAEIAEIAAFETADGRSIEVRIEDDHAGIGRAFGSVDEYVSHLTASQEEATTVTVRRDLWERLGAANGPFVVSLLDPSASVVVGDRRYTATETSVYRRPVDDPDADPEIVVYYGADGEGELREYKALFELVSLPERLGAMSFNNPHVQELADRVVAAGGLLTDAPEEAAGAQGLGGDPTDDEAQRARMWGLEIVESPTYSVLRLDGTPKGTFWDVRIRGYNQDYGSWWQGYRAAGHTGLSIYDASDGGWGAAGFGNRPSDLQSYVDLSLVLKRDSPQRAWSTKSCTTNRAGLDEPELDYQPIFTCPNISLSGSRATGWDPESEHGYTIYTYVYDSFYLYHIGRTLVDNSFYIQ